MAAAGYDVAAGDTWALNEVSSAVRRGDGNGRANVRELLRGLYDAAGEGPPTRGVVFVVGVGQRVPELGDLQGTGAGVVPGRAVLDRRERLRERLVAGGLRGRPQLRRPRCAARRPARRARRVPPPHGPLAAAGSAVSGTANAFLGNAGSTLANAAWQWESAFGWTAVDDVLMQQFVSAEVYALRNHGVRTGRATDRFGFAWAPKNLDALAPSDFTRRTGAVLDRMATAIRDSGADSPADPGIAACGSSGVWCAGDLAGASLTAGWRGFRAWSPTTLAFVSAPQTIAAGAISKPVSLQVQVAAVAARPAAAVSATITSSSPTGLFATSPGGPFAPTLAVQLPAGAFATAQLYYQDPTAGTATLNATAAGVVAGTQQIMVGGAAPVSLRVEPATATVLPGGAVALTAVGVDAFGNATPTAALWTVSPTMLGGLSAAMGTSTTFTAGTEPGIAQASASVTTPSGTLSATSSVTVTPPPPVRVAAVRYGVAQKQLHVYVTVVDGEEGGCGTPPSPPPSTGTGRCTPALPDGRRPVA